MKLLIKLGLLLTITLLINSCGLSNSPESTANQFMKYLAQENYEAAKRVSTETTGKLIDLIQAAQSLANKNQQTKETKPVFECNCEEENEKATCQCCQEEDKEECVTLHVFQVEGQWLVDMKKENVLN